MSGPSTPHPPAKDPAAILAELADRLLGLQVAPAADGLVSLCLQKRSLLAALAKAAPLERPPLQKKLARVQARICAGLAAALRG